MQKSNQWSDFKNEHSLKIAITKPISFVKGESAPFASEVHKKGKFELCVPTTRLRHLAHFYLLQTKL
jgi:hypothetical protein